MKGKEKEAEEVSQAWSLLILAASLDFLCHDMHQLLLCRTRHKLQKQKRIGPRQPRL